MSDRECLKERGRENVGEWKRRDGKKGREDVSEWKGRDGEREEGRVIEWIKETRIATKDKVKPKSFTKEKRCDIPSESSKAEQNITKKRRMQNESLTLMKN